VATIEVCDTGTGIAPGEAHRVFDRFRSGSQKANRRSPAWGWPWPATWSPVTAAGWS
jgi:signal transduction histidine kinase